MIIYGGVQLTKKTHFIVLMSLITPFMLYLTMIYFYANLIYIGVLSLLFYLFVTHKRFVAFCKKYKTEGLFLADES
jgi:hypothetical protein